MTWPPRMLPPHRKLVHAAGIMIAAAAAVQPRRAAELAQHGDHRFLQQAALLQIVDQGGEGQVELRAQMAFVIEVGVVQAAAVGVHVPAGLAEDRVEVVDRDVADAAFDQPAGHQAALAERVAAIAVAEPVVFRDRGRTLPWPAAR